MIRHFLQRMITLAAVFLLLTPMAPSWADQHGSGEASAAKEMKKEVSEALQAIKDYSAEQKEIAAQRAEELLKEIDEEIEKLEKRLNEDWERMSRASREQTREALEALREERKEIDKRYEGLKKSSVNAWEEVKKGFVEGYGELRESLRKAAEKFD